MPDLSIIFVNYNTRDKLRDCLLSIEKYKASLDLEIIVVDNDSHDGSPEMLREEFADSVMLIEPHRNTWFSGGNNIGVKAATSEIILLLNADTLIQPNLLQELRDTLVSDEKIGAVTCRQQHPDGEWINNCSLQPQYLDLLLGYTGLGIIFSSWRDERRRKMWYDGWGRDTDKSVEVAPGSCIMTYRDLLLSFDVFNEELKLYFTDDDLCRSILATGHEICFLAEPVLLHYEKSTVRNITRQAREIYFEDMLYFSRKHFGFLRTFFLRLLVIPTRLGMDVKYWLTSN